MGNKFLHFSASTLQESAKSVALSLVFQVLFKVRELIMSASFTRKTQTKNLEPAALAVIALLKGLVATACL